MNVDPQTVKTQQEDPFGRAGLAAEIAGQMQRKGEAELVGVAKYYRMAGLPAKKALETAALQAAASMWPPVILPVSQSVPVEAKASGSRLHAATLGPNPAQAVAKTPAISRT